MRIEIMIDKNQKVSQAIVEAFQAEIHSRIVSIYPATTIRVRQGSVSRIEMQGFSLDEDKQRISEIIQNVWEDDSWLH
ncbi:DinI-like family protein [Pantoea sp.]|uniref:DinI-like family protein n=1 Tax=Pantoea sp. TaxID=69393 RepID=UPI0028A82AF7|nr:DinI-like family protein [Pantoea sp.]